MIIVFFLSLLWVISASADTLIIKFRSGKMQEVKLDEKIENVEFIQFIVPKKEVKDITPENPESDKVPTVKKDTVTEKRENKSGFRLKWAPPQFNE
ncbi:MAG: hypothetical protein ACK415_09240 [Thermodesulfovibrionales bacterium]